MDKNGNLTKEAIEYIKASKKELIERFASLSIFPTEEIPVSVFMAGSPGAGKTEFSKNLIKEFEKEDQRKVVRIDADEIRCMLPGYTGKNSYIFQHPCSMGVDYLHDSVIRGKQNFVLDGTFANYEKSLQNIERSLKRKRDISIIYLYQNPFVAWGYAKKRERLEGRYIPKEAFIGQFFLAKMNVNKIKEEFGEKVKVDLIENDFNIGLKKIKLNIKSIDSHLSTRYSEDELKKKLL